MVEGIAGIAIALALVIGCFMLAMYIFDAVTGVRLLFMRVSHRNCANCKYSRQGDSLDSYGYPYLVCGFRPMKKIFDYSLGYYVEEKVENVPRYGRNRIGNKTCHWEAKNDGE